jgi:UDP-glucuronate decarboxylase
MRILVTGGTGFIGSHLCKRLLNEGHYIICLDNNFTGKMENITSIKNNPNFEFIRHDITQPILLEVDQIYHLACPASPKAYQYNPIKTIKTNILGTLNALGIAKRVKATILLTSTSEVYGDPTINPQVEEYWGNVNPIGIRSCYDEGKRVAETLMMEYNRSNQTQIRIARIFNTYGSNMDKNDGRVISNFINQAINNTDITIYGNGDQTRSFCYVDDTVDALIRLMNQSETNGPINIGNPYEMTMNELAQQILKLMPYSSSKIIYKPLPDDDPRQRRPDITKAEEYLDWRPTTNLEDGLNKTIKYFLDIY